MPCFKIRFGLPIRNYVPAKMEERLNVAKQHIQFDKVQADTKYKEQADDMLARVKDLQKFTK
jgi:Mg-chelatase subunit ChlI